MSKQHRQLSAFQGGVLALFGMLLLLVSITSAASSIGEITSTEPVVYGSSLEVEKVFTVANSSAESTNSTHFTLDVFVFLTNDGLNDTHDVRIDAYALESSSGLGWSTSNTMLGDLPAQTSKSGVLQLVIPRNTSYDIELLVWKEGRVVITAEASVSIAAQESSGDASSSDYSVNQDDSMAGGQQGQESYRDEAGSSASPMFISADQSSFTCMIVLVGFVFLMGYLINRSKPNPLAAVQSMLAVGAGELAAQSVTPKAVREPFVLPVPAEGISKLMVALGALLILSSVWVSLYTVEPESLERPEGGPMLVVVNMFPLTSPLAGNESTLSLSVIITNAGDESTEAVELRAFAVESSSGIARGEATTVVSVSEAEKTATATLEMVIPDGERYVIWLLATKENKIVLHGKRIIVSAGGSGSAQGYSTVKADVQGSPRALAIWATTPDPEPWNLHGIPRDIVIRSHLLGGIGLIGAALSLLMINPERTRTIGVSKPDEKANQGKQIASIESEES